MNKRPVVMLVDDNVTNLTLGKNLLKDQYQVFTVPSAAKLFDLLEKVPADIILLDVEMPEMDGFETIKKLKAEAKTAAIPVVFLTAHGGEANQEAGLALGAAGYVTKPFNGPLLTAYIGRLLSGS